MGIFDPSVLLNAPQSAYDLGNQQIGEQFKQQMMPLQLQGQQVQNQTAQDQMNNARRANAFNLMASIGNLPEERQQATYETLKPVFSRMAPDLQLPDQYDRMTAKALVTSSIPAEKLATNAIQSRLADIEQQKADQGNFEIVKDIYGNPTGFMNKKTGQIMQNDVGMPAAPPVDAQGNPLIGEDYLKTLPPQQGAIVKAIGEGRMAPLSGLALTRGPGLKVMQDVQNAYPDYNANSYGALKEWNTGKLGNTVRSLNVANDHLDTLGQYAQALQNGDTKAINSLSNMFQTQFGKTAPANFDSVKQIVGDEVVKAVLGGAGGLGDREEIKKNINAANSPEQLAGVITAYKQLMRGQLNGLQQQYETSTGRKDFLNRLSEKTRQEIAGGGEPGQAQSAPAIAAPTKGVIEDGYIFMGGDPADPKSWKAVK